jgi:hypothetical protein
MWASGQRHGPAALPSGLTRYPLYRRLDRPQGRSARVRMIPPPPRIDLRTVQPVERFTSCIMCILFQNVYIIQIHTYYFNVNFQSNCNQTLLFTISSSYAIFLYISAPTVYSRISTYIMYYYYYYFNVIRVSYFINVFYLRMILKESQHVESLIFSVKITCHSFIFKKSPNSLV